MASSQINELFATAFEFAQRMLSEHQEFHPFGVSMGMDGNVAMVAGYAGDDFPPAQDVIDLLQSNFIDQAKDRTVLAAEFALMCAWFLPAHFQRPTPSAYGWQALVARL